ncbi:hypothetical protein [Vreelandella sp. EE22]
MGIRKEFRKRESIYSFMIVSFITGIIFHYLLGKSLPIEYVVSISLVVIGASWSFLTIEINQISQLRNEYMKELNEFEESMNYFLSKSFEMLLKNVRLSKLETKDKESDELESVYILTQELRVAFDLMNYKMAKIKKSSVVISHTKIKELNEHSTRIYKNVVNDFIEVHQDRKKISNDEMALFNKRSHRLRILMLKALPVGELSFENFSIRYKAKKSLCICIVLFCIFIVLFKGIASFFHLPA